MKTKYLDSQIRGYRLLDEKGKLPDSGKEQLKELEAIKEALNLHLVISRLFRFEEFCRTSYQYSVNDRFFKNGYEIDYGEGITKEQAYEAFKNHNAI